MADITLDPDDPAAWAAAEKGKGASGTFNNLQGDVKADLLQVCLLIPPPVRYYLSSSDYLLFFFPHFFPTLYRSPAALLGGNLFFFSLLHRPYAKKSRSPSLTAAPQRHLTIVPAPPIQPPPPRLLPLPQPPPAPVASTSASVSPSPFAPRAQITKSSSSSSSHLATKEAPDVDRVHADRSAVPVGLEAPAGNEYVIAHATASQEDAEERLRDSPRDAGQSAIGGVQKTLTVDPPLDQGLPSHQVCLSLRAVLCVRIHRVIESRTTLGHHQPFVIIAILPLSPKALAKNSLIPSVTNRKSVVFSPSVRPSPSRQRQTPRASRHYIHHLVIIIFLTLAATVASSPSQYAQQAQG